MEYKRKIGYVPETVEIYENLTAYEYLTFIGEVYGLGLEQVNKKAKRLMALLGIEEVYHSKIASYSKGMKQKLLLISSLIHNPDILFLDEPLSGLDANSGSLAFCGMSAALHYALKDVDVGLFIYPDIDGIFAGNDLMAIGALKALHERNSIVVVPGANAQCLPEDLDRYEGKIAEEIPLVTKNETLHALTKKLED